MELKTSAFEFSVRPGNIARAEVSITNQPFLDDETSADLALKRIIDPAHGDVTRLVGPHRPSASNIRDLLDGKELHCVLLDAYLDLAVHDIVSTEIWHPKSFVVDSLVAKYMQETKKGADTHGMAPKAKGKRQPEFWFEQEL